MSHDNTRKNIAVKIVKIRHVKIRTTYYTTSPNSVAKISTITVKMKNNIRENNTAIKRDSVFYYAFFLPIIVFFNNVKFAVMNNHSYDQWWVKIATSLFIDFC